MKKQINLYFDFEFTSLSPDAQPISLGIVSDDIHRLSQTSQFWKFALTGDDSVPSESYSFYAEFCDFDINRCDDWVKENVVSKLKLQDCAKYISNGGNKGMYEVLDFKDNTISCYGDTERIKTVLKQWLSQFSDYQIQFVADCGTFDWYWMLQLLGEWETSSETVAYAEDETFMSYPDKVKNLYNIMDKAKGRPIRIMHHAPSLPTCDFSKGIGTCTIYMDKSPVQIVTRVGLPKLPANISPVPQDLNDLIAFKKGITVLEAFNTSREELALGHHSEGLLKRMKGLDNYMENKLALDPINGEKHNALWDAKIIKKCYQKLTQ